MIHKLVLMNSYKEKNNEKTYGLLTLIVVGIFVAFKFQDLFLPYFWDELGVYSRACLYLAEHGLGILPASLPPVWSRGHPLLFQFIYGLGFTIFGKSVVVGHSISLLVTCLLLLGLYKKISSFYNRLIGFCVVLLLCAQPVFLAQSTFVLPEMMLTLFAFLAITSYYQKQFGWFALYASLAMMTKESAIVIPFVAFAYGFIQDIILKQKAGYFTLGSLLLTFFPLIVFGVFLLIQKEQNGWCFLPEHVGYVSFKLADILDHNHRYQNFFFYNQGRYWWVKVLLIGSSFALLKAKTKLNNSFVLLSSIFIGAFLAFGSLNFYMDRYMLAVFPFLTALVVIAAYTIFTNKFWLTGITLLLSVLCLHDLDPGWFNYDCDMGFKHHLNVEQKLIDKLCEINSIENEISPSFPVYVAWTDSNTGFRVCPGIIQPTKKFYKKTYLEYTSEHGGIPLETDSCKLIFRIKENCAEGMIYEKTN